MDPSIDQGHQVSKDGRGEAQNPHCSRSRFRATWVLGLVLLMGLIALQTPVLKAFLEKGLSFEPGKSRIASLRILLLLTVDVSVIFAWIVSRRADLRFLLVCVGVLFGTWVLSVHIAFILSAVLHQFM